MPRRALIGLAVGLWASGAALALDPHLDPNRVPGGCRSCHEGHGVPRSPMLRGPQNALCLECHDTQARADAQVRAGTLAPGARPALLGGPLASASRHPLTPEARSRFEPGVVVCASCHSPHRRSTRSGGAPVEGLPRTSTRSPRQLEHRLCESCHGQQGPRTASRFDLARLLEPASRSFHPVHAATEERSPSVTRALAGRQISCTDCHGNGDPQGARGPHGSPYSFILAANYVVSDGATEGASTYALCWSCHDRELVLGASSPFPAHRLHVVDERASCATCHSPHGSISNRALIRFGEETTLAGVSASASLGRLEFVSESAGSGSCALTCHGVDHAPKGYGSHARLLELLDAAGATAPATPAAPPPPLPPGASRPRLRDRAQTPPPLP